MDDPQSFNILQSKNCISCESLKNGFCEDLEVKIDIPVLSGCVVCVKND